MLEENPEPEQDSPELLSHTLREKLPNFLTRKRFWQLRAQEWIESDFRRRMDQTFAVGVFPVALVGMGAAWAALKIESIVTHGNGVDGPIFFTQKRYGAGKWFNLPKIRTMRGEPQPGEGRGLDRITKVGKLLRRYSLDELPQIWLIAKAEMAWSNQRPLASECIDDMEASAYQDPDFFKKNPIVAELMVHNPEFLTNPKVVRNLELAKTYPAWRKVLDNPKILPGLWDPGWWWYDNLLVRWGTLKYKTNRAVGNIWWATEGASLYRDSVMFFLHPQMREDIKTIFHLGQA